MDFFTGFLWSILKDIFLFFALFYIGGWIADWWGLGRMERAWWMSLLTVALLTFVLWFRFGKILLWV